MVEKCESMVGKYESMVEKKPVYWTILHIYRECFLQVNTSKRCIKFHIYWDNM